MGYKLTSDARKQHPRTRGHHPVENPTKTPIRSSEAQISAAKILPCGPDHRIEERGNPHSPAIGRFPPTGARRDGLEFWGVFIVSTRGKLKHRRDHFADAVRERERERERREGERGGGLTSGERRRRRAVEAGRARWVLRLALPPPRLRLYCPLLLQVNSTPSRGGRRWTGQLDTCGGVSSTQAA